MIIVQVEGNLHIRIMTKDMACWKQFRQDCSDLIKMYILRKSEHKKIVGYHIHVEMNR